jgi:hypothetical protein
VIYINTVPQQAVFSWYIKFSLNFDFWWKT